MNYTLQVVKGRSEARALRLIEGVNSIGRHDDCLIRIRSSQVSRRHCELFETEGRLFVRDLGSSNGTFVNGVKILGQQALNPGDVITVGGVALRLDSDAAAAVAAPKAAPSPGDTAEVEALSAVEDDGGDDFEVGLDFEVGEPAFDQPPDHLDIIPLEDEEPAPAKVKAKAKGAAEPKDEDQPTEPAAGEPPIDDAVADFLLDLKLDEDD